MRCWELQFLTPRGIHSRLVRIGGKLRGRPHANASLRAAGPPGQPENVLRAGPLQDCEFPLVSAQISHHMFHNSPATSQQKWMLFFGGGWEKCSHWSYFNYFGQVFICLGTLNIFFCHIIIFWALLSQSINLFINIFLLYLDNFFPYNLFFFFFFLLLF